MSAKILSATSIIGFWFSKPGASTATQPAQARVARCLQMTRAVDGVWHFYQIWSAAAPFSVLGLRPNLGRSLSCRDISTLTEI
jgi:hypothetical protein